MYTIAAIVIVTLFGVLFTAMAVAPALIESSSPAHPRPRLVVIESPPTRDGGDGQPRAA